MWRYLTSHALALSRTSGMCAKATYTTLGRSLAARGHLSTERIPIEMGTTRYHASHSKQVIQGGPRAF
jgi:hypothetical protein